MPWFRVDDSFWSHPKAIAAGPALALWLRAGCWCAQQLTDGFVRRDALPMLGGTATTARKLVEARSVPDGPGLWEVVAGGWVFHDWSDYQPSKADVEAERSAARDRMKRARDAKRSGRGSPDVRPNAPANTRAPRPVDNGKGTVKSEHDHDEITNDQAHTYPPVDYGTDRSDLHKVQDVRPNTGRSSDNPGPARPVPKQNPLLTLAGRLTEVSADDLAASLPPELIDEWQALAGSGVDLEDEARAYLARHGDTTPRDPRAAWLGWLRRAAQHRAAQAPAEPARQGCADPACLDGWLPDNPDTGQPVPCRTCRPHLQPIPTTEAS